MKKKVFLILSVICTSFSYAQEVNEEKKLNNFSIITKGKLGFSELKIDDYGSINGFYTAFELLAASKLSDKYSLEYGFGFSEFKANNVSQSNTGNVKNENFYIPVNLLRSVNFTGNNTFQIGVGLYGDYLYKSKIDGLLEEENIGFTMGLNFQVGAKFKIAEKTFFRVMIEAQSDLTNLKKKAVEFRQINTNTISLSFIHGF
ncbi:MAG TPA: outer membrane beta-barrel protein [Flavobacterium sp.]|uniref:outer membrane beta-barrel protein n=1 Tax=unclassified Flavobacterium TaxID=196869 RepID=UPI0025C29FFA|nr:MULTISPECIES: outer membrane beta-barrel protein [unclassified Flavobacterium]HRE76810.1 outer membrane beta-barrel protein [Flavobacterium sp.]